MDLLFAFAQGVWAFAGRHDATGSRTSMMTEVLGAIGVLTSKPYIQAGILGGPWYLESLSNSS